MIIYRAGIKKAIMQQVAIFADDQKQHLSTGQLKNKEEMG
ncbi:hypothetical protein N425_02125 [Tannerella sp. oral taxon BU063 isolate Cell 2]|uniref:Uncharacterized protein n=1 Tax=Tannerella sp. oral taxon BU063 isolate Cell 2 TaxID=1411148 RepID=W2C8R0_9BACT|nr:hypothetical protein N425_02125 [Tannerella sp. oral taxon BU063 isolate Cell 2]